MVPGSGLGLSHRSFCVVELWHRSYRILQRRTTTNIIHWMQKRSSTNINDEQRRTTSDLKGFIPNLTTANNDEHNPLDAKTIIDKHQRRTTTNNVGPQGVHTESYNGEQRRT